MALGSELAPFFGAAGGVGAGPTSDAKSLRFNSADSAYLDRTPGSAGNRKTWTWSGWVKRAVPSNTNHLFVAGAGEEQAIYLNGLTGSATLVVSRYSGGFTYYLETSAVFRDPSAWYHIHVAYDTSQSTASDRVKIYVNGVQITTFSSLSYPTLNSEYEINNTNIHKIGRYMDGYLADVHFIDGQALAATDFGAFDATTGVWNPIAYTGSYGTNGFKLDFLDSSSVSALGTDTSGQGNDWTPNNFSVTAGAGNDSLADFPSNGTETDNGAGGEVSGNYATLNPAFNQISRGSFPGGTITNGNLTLSGGSSSEAVGYSTIAIPQSGKWYFEVTAETVGSDHYVQLASTATTLAYSEQNVTTLSHNIASSGDVLGYAINRDTNTYTVYKNGSLYSTGSVSAYDYLVRLYDYASFTHHINFGQRRFARPAPSGFKALCTANFDTPTIADPSTVMDVPLYTGNGTSQSVTLPGAGFEPDMVWIKERTNARYGGIYDKLRGERNVLITALTSAEYGAAPSGKELTSFNSAGFSVGQDYNIYVNDSSSAYVAWCWDAGTSTASNTDGTITSQVRANTSAGFSIVTFTGNGSAGATVGHGLGVAPSFYVLKSRSNATNWPVYHAGLTNPEQKILILSSTSAEVTISTYWNDTAPTSSVFSLGTDLNANGNTYTYVAYCWAAVEGYSAFGSYTGNNSSNGPFVYTGFRPRWVMTKASSRLSAWYIHDTARGTYNVIGPVLAANTAAAETTPTRLDILSNGFKIRDNDTEYNASGDTYTYAAFAESPFAYARAR